MPVDRTLERTSPDWALYVADFPSDEWNPTGWVSARLHVRPTARLKVEQQKSERQGDLVWIAFGPHAQLFIPRAIASRLRELLDALFSAGVPIDASSSSASVNVTDSPPDALTAPAEPPQPDDDDETDTTEDEFDAMLRQAANEVRPGLGDNIVIKNNRVVPPRKETP